MGFRGTFGDFGLSDFEGINNGIFWSSVHTFVLCKLLVFAALADKVFYIKRLVSGLQVSLNEFFLILEPVSLKFPICFSLHSLDEFSLKLVAPALSRCLRASKDPIPSQIIQGNRNSQILKNQKSKMYLYKVK